MPPRAELSPYVGSRHFERTEDDRRRFFGRERETEELTALVMSHKVVLVYAASGAGKSSLINAGVIPKLVEEDFEVLPRGRVGVALPPDAVGDSNPYVLNLLASLSPGADLRSLARTEIADYLRGLPRRVDNAGRVLVIDQAEELFTFLPSNWQRRQREFFVGLRDALRDAPDLRVVLVTREDYLARFDDLAPLVPGGLRMRLHLEPLGRDAAREAVEKPLAATRWRFDAGVADKLVDDLSRMKVGIGTGDIHDEPGPYVEPVQLQIVCSALWSKLPDGVEVITAEHLQRFGDVEDTLERFYEETIAACVRETHCDKEQLARWFGEELITPAGTRGQVFRGPTDTGGLPNHVVAFLDARHLIRADERASGRWYELAHDRLVRPIRTINERWSQAFDAARARRKALRIARRRAALGVAVLAVAAALAVAIVVPSLKAKTLERALTTGRIDELTHECSPAPGDCREKKVRVFDVVADYYWRQDRIDELAALLRNRSAWIPPDYGMPTLTEVRSGDRPSDPELVVAYNPARPVDEWRMRTEWAQRAEELGRSWGLPVMKRIVLVPDERVALSSVRITGTPESCSGPRERTQVSASLNMPTTAGALISLADLRGNARLYQFFDRYRREDGWSEYKDLKLNGPWWFVPTWTLPVWRIGGLPAMSREAALATMVADDVLNHPELILSCSALETMLSSGATQVPTTLGEAIAARGLEGLRRDFIELVRTQRRSLVYLPMVLDALAKHPGRSSAEAATLADREMHNGDRSDASLHGAWQTPTTIDPRKLAPSGPYRDIDLPGFHRAIRIRLGPAIQGAITTQHDLKEDIVRQIDDAQAALYHRYGILPPEFEYTDAPTGGLRVEVLNQSAASPGADVLGVTAVNAGEQLLRTLEAREREFRVWWLTPERARDALSRVRPGERAWLDAHYSLTDLKRIARAVIGGDDDKDGADTLRDVSWLLRSLVFWVHVRDPANAQDLAAAIRDLQRTRLHPRAGAAADPRVARSLQRGLAALDADRPGEAEQAFLAAIRTDRNAAIAGFLALYPAASSLAPDRRSAMLTAACRAPSARTLVYSLEDPPPRWIEYELADLLAAPGAQVTTTEWQRFEACLLWSIAERGSRPHELQRRWSTLFASTRPESWSRDESLLIAEHWLVSHRDDVAPAAEIAAAQQLLSQSLSALDADTTRVVWQRLLVPVLGPRPLRWARDLVADVADGLPASSRTLKLAVAGWLAGFGEADALRALRLVESVAAGRTASELWDQRWMTATILANLAAYAEPAQRAERYATAAGALRALATIAVGPEQLRTASVALAALYVQSGDDEPARAAIRDGARGGEPGAFDELAFLIALGQGDAVLAGEIAARKARSVADDALGGAHALRMAAVFALLTHQADFESTARRSIFHAAAPEAGADFVRLMLQWALAVDQRDVDAAQLIDQRMRDIHVASWPERLRQRDSMVWREMLVAYAAGAIPESQIFDPLHDAHALQASGLDQTERSLDGLRCEAYFYAALHDQVTGDPATREQRYRDKLQRVVATHQYGLYEYRMAQFLLARRRT
jgi:hypothetical protein